MTRVLRVVARVDLVGDELDDVVARGRDVEVDDDAAAEIALVVVERPPGLVSDLVDLERLACRQVDDRRRARAQLAEQLPAEGHDLVCQERGSPAARPRSARRGRRPAGAARRAARGPPRRPRCSRAAAGPRSSARPRPSTRAPRPRARPRTCAARAPGRAASRPRAAASSASPSATSAAGSVSGSASTCSCSSAGPQYESTRPSTCRPSRSPRRT